MPTPPTLDGYDIVRRLGAGTFADVWAAEDVRLDREVAVKVLAEAWCRDPTVRRSFMNEARVLVTAESPRLARGFAVAETSDGRPALVMALADRGTLAARMAAREPDRRFTPHETFSIVAELAGAVADVHALGQLHRDVKPSNVLVMTVPPGARSPRLPGLGDDERIVVGDFGLVHRGEDAHRAIVGGSPGYVSPEQASGGAADERSDLYSLGMIALEMLSGRAPDTPETLQRASEPTGQRSDVRARLDAVDLTLPDAAVDLLVALSSFDPQRRPRSAGDVAQQCDEIASTLAPGRPDGSPASRRATGPISAGSVGPVGRDGRRGLWGQDLHIGHDDADGVGQPPPARAVMRPGATDDTLIRPTRRGPVFAAAPQAAEVGPSPRVTARTIGVVSAVIGAAMLALSAVLWF